MLNCNPATTALLSRYVLYVWCRQMGGQGPMQGQATHFFRCVPSPCLQLCPAGQQSSLEVPKLPAPLEDDAADSQLTLLQICTRED